MLIDTHCHIHDLDYPLDADETIEGAHASGVMQMICIGTDEENSKIAIDFATKHDDVFASVGVHPHDAKNGWSQIIKMVENRDQNLVAVGEIGLDYHYDYSPRDVQIQALKSQMELALNHDLPIIFHVREAYDDFWKIYDEFIEKGAKIKGVLHSFTDSPENMQKALDRGLYIGINGYSTFTKDESQKAMFAALSIDKILFETDAPYLTPAPFRGKVNVPAYVRNIAAFHSLARGISLDEIAAKTTSNASDLFGLSSKQ
jgi:TatD DNase family protein